MLDETYSDLAAAGRKAEGAIKRTIKEFYPYFILFFDIVFTVSSTFFTGAVVNPFSAQFFINLATSITTTMLCYTCYLGYGERREKETMPGFSENWARWASLSRTVRADKQEEFNAFCLRQVTEEREGKRREIIENRTTISYRTYLEKYRTMTKKQLSDLARAGTLSQSDARAILRANGKIRVRPIRPLLILCGTRSGSLNDAGRSGVSYTALSLVSRPVMMLIVSAVLNMFTGTFTGLADGSTIFRMIYQVLMIVLASMTGYAAGGKNVAKESDRVKARTLFLERFLENEKTEKAG